MMGLNRQEMSVAGTQAPFLMCARHVTSNCRRLARKHTIVTIAGLDLCVGLQMRQAELRWCLRHGLGDSFLAPANILAFHRHCQFILAFPFNTLSFGPTPAPGEYPVKWHDTKCISSNLTS